MPNYTQLKRGYTTKPPPGTLPGPASSYGFGLGALWGLTEGGGGTTRDALRGLAGTLGAASSWVSTPLGPGISNTSAAASGIITLSGPQPIAALPFTLLAWVVLNTASTAGAFIKFGDTNSGFALGVGGTTMDGAGNNLLGLIETIAWVASGTAIGTGLHQVALTGDTAKNYTLYLDGKQVFTQNTAPASVAAANSASLLGYSTRNPLATLVYAAAWPRALANSEMRRAYAAPFALWAAPRLPLALPASSRSGAPIIYVGRRSRGPGQVGAF